MKTEIVDGNLVITLPVEYIKNSAEYGLTTGCEAVVTDTDEMLEHYAQQMTDVSDDCHFNRCLDLIAEDALENGESWIDVDEGV